VTGAFRRKKSGSLLAWCRDCYCEFHRAYNRGYYQRERERERYRRIRLERQRKIRLLVARLRHDQPCGDCGITFPYFLLEFDHVRGKKAFGLGQAQTVMLSHARLLDEAAKCEIVCVNCHRRRSFEANALRNNGLVGKRLLRTPVAILRALKRRSVCADCRIRHPYFLLDLDHRHGKTKALSRLVNEGLSIDSLRTELAKCDVVCANCHSYRTVMRRYEAGDPTLLALWDALGFAPVGRARAVG